MKKPLVWQEVFLLPLKAKCKSCSRINIRLWFLQKIRRLPVKRQPIENIERNYQFSQEYCGSMIPSISAQYNCNVISPFENGANMAGAYTKFTPSGLK